MFGGLSNHHNSEPKVDIDEGSTVFFTVRRPLGDGIKSFRQVVTNFHSSEFRLTSLIGRLYGRLLMHYRTSYLTLIQHMDLTATVWPLKLLQVWTTLEVMTTLYWKRAEIFFAKTSGIGLFLKLGLTRVDPQIWGWWGPNFLKFPDRPGGRAH